MAYNPYTDPTPEAPDPKVRDRALAKALQMMVDEYGTQNYGCAWCPHVGPKSPHSTECPITIASAAIKNLQTSKVPHLA